MILMDCILFILNAALIIFTISVFCNMLKVADGSYADWCIIVLLMSIICCLGLMGIGICGKLVTDINNHRNHDITKTLVKKDGEYISKTEYKYDLIANELLKIDEYDEVYNRALNYQQQVINDFLELKTREKLDTIERAVLVDEITGLFNSSFETLNICGDLLKSGIYSEEISTDFNTAVFNITNSIPEKVKLLKSDIEYENNIIKLEQGLVSKELALKEREKNIEHEITARCDEFLNSLNNERIKLSELQNKEKQLIKELEQKQNNIDKIKSELNVFIREHDVKRKCTKCGKYHKEFK